MALALPQALLPWGWCSVNSELFPLLPMLQLRPWQAQAPGERSGLGRAKPPSVAGCQEPGLPDATAPRAAFLEERQSPAEDSMLVAMGVPAHTLWTWILP